jgi:hypothetical protein
MPKTSHLFVQNTAKRLRLAYLDWNLCPLATIREELGCNYGHIGEMRKHPDYIEEFKALKESWQEKMRALPGHNDTAKIVQFGMHVSAKELAVRAAERKTGTRDLIGICRLFAQMDGTFMSKTAFTTDEQPLSEEKETVAQALAQILKRRDTVQ